jgi:hypothetical protein
MTELTDPVEAAILRTSQWELAKLRELFDLTGRKFLALAAIKVCARDRRLILPDWAAQIYADAVEAVSDGTAATLDDAFERRSLSKKTRRDRELIPKIFGRAIRLISEDPGKPIDTGFFDALGKEFAIGTTRAKEYYYAGKSRAVTMMAMLMTLSAQTGWDIALVDANGGQGLSVPADFRKNRVISEITARAESLTGIRQGTERDSRRPSDAAASQTQRARPRPNKTPWNGLGMHHHGAGLCGAGLPLGGTGDTRKAGAIGSKASRVVRGGPRGRAGSAGGQIRRYPTG